MAPGGYFKLIPELYTQEEQTQLLQIARDSVKHGIESGTALAPSPGDFEEHLQEPAAAFVTLEKRGDLRGCIGSVEAYRPLVVDVAENAWHAAFQDPRFPPVSREEYNSLTFEISVLTQPRELSFNSEDDLKSQINPGQDGLILIEGYNRGLFLPSVWEKLPDTDLFLAHLKQKAGLSSHYWSDTVRAKRFHSFEFGDAHD